MNGECSFSSKSADNFLKNSHYTFKGKIVFWGLRLGWSWDYG